MTMTCLPSLHAATGSGRPNTATLYAEAIVTAIAGILMPDTGDIVLAFMKAFKLWSCCLGLPLAYRGTAD